MYIRVKNCHRNSLSTAVNMGQRWRPLRHTSDVIRHCAETTAGQTLIIDGSGASYITVVEVRPIMSLNKHVAKEMQFLAMYDVC